MTAGVQRLRARLSSAYFERLPPLIVVGAGVLLLWFSLPTFESLHAIWVTDSDYTHSYLILVLTVGLVIAEARRAPITVEPSYAGAACLLALVFVMMVGHASTTVLIAQLALPAFWVAAIWALAGSVNARRFVPPLAYLFFAIPVWTLLVEPMRSLTVLMVGQWIRAAGLPAFIEGNLVHVPTGTFEVQGGCAGLRYLLVAASLSVFPSLLNRRGLVPSVTLAMCGVALALLGNWLRVFATVAAGLSPEGQIPLLVHNHHTLFGWIVFVVFMLPLFYLDRILDRRNPVDDDVPIVPAPTEAAGKSKAAAYVLCTALLVSIWLNQRIFAAGDIALRVSLSAPEVPGWARTATWDDRRVPVFVGATAVAAAWYGRDTSRVGAYLAHYAQQRQEHEVVFKLNRPEGQYAQVVARQSAFAVTASGSTIPFGELEVADADGRHRLVWLGLRVAGSPTARRLEAKVLQTYAILRGRRDAQALVLTAVCDSGCDAARASLSSYATAAVEPLYSAAERSAGVDHLSKSTEPSRSP